MLSKGRLTNLMLVVLVLFVGTAMVSAQEEAGAFEQATFAIEGMTCGGCVGAVKVQLKKTPGVEGYEVSYETAEAVVTYDPEVTDPAAIAESISKSGFKAKVKRG